MTTKTLLSLATVSLLALAAQADDPTPSYTVETTNSWFSVTAKTDDLTTNWSGATRTRDNDLIKVDTEAGSPAFYTPAQLKPSATRYRVTGNMTVTLNAGVPAAFTGNDLPKAALVAASVNEGNKWYGWDGTQWVVLSNITTPPADGTAYPVAIEFFVVSEQLNIKYIVGNESQTVTTIEDELPTLTKVGLAGYGSFGDFGALGFDSFEVTIDIDESEVAAVKTAMGIVGAITPDALNKVGENGLTKWESIVLGLPNQNTKPYTAPVQTNNGNLGFTIGAAEIGKYNVSGANVKVEVYSSATANGTFTTVANQTQGDSSNQYKATVTPDSSGVKYYKIKITFQ